MKRADVHSIEAIREFRPTLVKFAEQARQAIGEVQAEVQRTMAWLEQEQGPFWQRQIRKCHEQVRQAKLALNQKRMYASPTGGRQTAVDEERALKRAKRRLEIAEEKLKLVQRWRRELDREWARQQGQLQRLGRSADHEIPRAIALLERMSRSLEAYVDLTAPSTGASGDATEQGSMARGGETPDDAEAADVQADEEDTATDER